MVILDCRCLLMHGSCHSSHPVIEARVAEVHHRDGLVQPPGEGRHEGRLAGARRPVEQVPAPPGDAVRGCSASVNHTLRGRHELAVVSSQGCVLDTIKAGVQPIFKIQVQHHCRLSLVTG